MSYPAEELAAALARTTNQRVTRPVLRYYGGKWRLASKILPLFPPHEIYTEAFGGGASVLLQKPRAHAEFYNDLDSEVVNVFRVLQVPARAARLERALRYTPFSRAEFEKSYRLSRCPVERARRTIVRSYMGFGSDSITRTKASRAGFNSSISQQAMKTGFRSNNMRSGVCAAVDWQRYPNHLRAFAERLQGVVIENRDARDLLAKVDRPGALHYVDPPYPKEVRNNGASESRVEHNYRHEMTNADHHALAELLHSLRGMVIISTYPSPFYAKLYRGWRHVTWTGRQWCHNQQQRTESVFMNPAAVAASNLTLF